MSRVELVIEKLIQEGSILPERRIQSVQFLEKEMDRAATRLLKKIADLSVLGGLASKLRKSNLKIH